MSDDERRPPTHQEELARLGWADQQQPGRAADWSRDLPWDHPERVRAREQYHGGVNEAGFDWAEWRAFYDDDVDTRDE